MPPLRQISGYTPEGYVKRVRERNHACREEWQYDTLKPTVLTHARSCPIMIFTWGSLVVWQILMHIAILAV